MYNDYWLEQINNNINDTNENIEITNTRLNEIKNIQTQMQISGDSYYQEINANIKEIVLIESMILFVLCMYVIYNFTARCLK